MLTSARPYIVALLALAFLLSGPVSAVASALEAGSSACGGTMTDRSADSEQHLIHSAQCHDSESVVCPGSGGISQCVALLALAICPDDLSIANPGAQPVHVYPSPDYQNPFPKTVNPPPEHHA